MNAYFTADLEISGRNLTVEAFADITVEDEATGEVAFPSRVIGLITDEDGYTVPTGKIHIDWKDLPFTPCASPTVAQTADFVEV